MAQMDKWTRFAGDRRGGVVERVAVIATAIALFSVTGARYLDRAAHNGSLQMYAFWQPKKTSPGIDYTPTASIREHGGSVRAPAGAILIDPCTGKPR
jgi:hypothetical protein